MRYVPWYTPSGFTKGIITKVKYLSSAWLLGSCEMRKLIIPSSAYDEDVYPECTLQVNII